MSVSPAFMYMIPAVVLGIAVLGLASCKNTTDEYLTREVCLRSHTQLMPITQFVPNGTGGTTPVITFYPMTVCDESRIETYRNPDYDPTTRARS